MLYAVDAASRHYSLHWFRWQVQLPRQLPAILLVLCGCGTIADPALHRGHLEFDGNIYQDYKSLKRSKATVIHSKPVKMLHLRSLRIAAFDAVADDLGRSHEGWPCMAGQETPEPSATRCKPFRAYNPSVLALGTGQGLLVTARVSNWSLCDWGGRGRPYADWPGSRWPDAIFEEYHSHVASARLAAADLASGAPSPGSTTAAGLVRVDGQVWARTRAPFFEIFRQGLEDPRVLSVRGEVRALVVYGKRAARREPTRLADERVEGVGAFRQALATLRGTSTSEGFYDIGMEDFVPLETDFDRNSQQKNWMPFVYQGAVYAVYQLVPKMKVLLVDESVGSAVLAHETESDPALSVLQHAEVRGGSQCVHVPESALYLGVAHVSRGRSMYTHFFLAFADTPPFGMLGVSREWCLAHEETFQTGKEVLCEGVQFVSGLALSHSNEAQSSSLVMTYGVMDCDARIAQIPLRTALKAIKFRAGQPRAGGASAAEEL
mmetsp:Transcript_123293/g.343333  ORF Transcript_123293/g.343333 Transcript_123293/m.343333 type:complete len:491 (-) Transcript_123293:29-1501(-)